jgi:hypothetical protein
MTKAHNASNRKLTQRFFASFMLLAYATILCSVRNHFANEVGLVIWCLALGAQLSIIFERLGSGSDTPTVGSHNA